MRQDSDIERDVRDELEWEPGLDANDIATSVKQGVVTLAGFVPSWSDKYEAEVAAKRVSGVRGIANDLEVRLPEEHPDPDIARDAVSAIKSQLPTVADNIRVIVKEGWVTLEGSVAWYFQKNTADSAVRKLKGVRGVTNGIVIKPLVQPSEIKRKIEDAFKRSAEVDASRVTVEVHGGEVILKGNVRSFAEREEAARQAWSAPGITKVENRIVVGP